MFSDEIPFGVTRYDSTQRDQQWRTRVEREEGSVSKQKRQFRNPINGEGFRAQDFRSGFKEDDASRQRKLKNMAHMRAEENCVVPRQPTARSTASSERKSDSRDGPVEVPPSARSLPRSVASSRQSVASSRRSSVPSNRSARSVSIRDHEHAHLVTQAQQKMKGRRPPRHQGAPGGVPPIPLTAANLAAVQGSSRKSHRSSAASQSARSRHSGALPQSVRSHRSNSTLGGSSFRSGNTAEILDRIVRLESVLEEERERRMRAERELQTIQLEQGSA